MDTPAYDSARDGGPYVRRAALVAFAWGLAMAPVAFGLPRCPVALLLHHPCPGCGMSRATWLFLRGDLRASWAMHPLAVPTVLATALIALATVRAVLVRGTLGALFDDAIGRAPFVLLLALQVAALALWIARMFGALGGPVPV